MFSSDFWEYGLYAGIVVGALIAALVLHYLAYSIFDRIEAGLEGSLVKRSRKPVRLLAALIAVLVVLPLVVLPEGIEEALRRAVGLGVVAAFGWLAVSSLGVMEDALTEGQSLAATDNLRARSIHTRVRVLRNAGAIIVTVITVAIMLMSFPSVRQLGVSMLASAGIIALVAGMAARPALANLIAGLQIALTQPIRLDDVVVIEGEWGRIEQITSSFVVVRIWDGRRLIVPLSYIVEHHVENWTWLTSDILATVLIYTDYTVPVDRVREELHTILKGTTMWDGQVWNLQVTDARDQTLELRALMSARNSSEAWDLRCHVREKLIEYLQRSHPEALPRMRADVSEAVVGRNGGSSS